MEIPLDSGDSEVKPGHWVIAGPLSRECAAYHRLEAALDGRPWPPEHKSICDLAVHGEPVEHIVYVHTAEQLIKKDEVTPYGSLTVGDVRGTMSAKAWDNVAETLAIAKPGAVVKVYGRLTVRPGWGTEIVIKRAEEAKPGEYVEELVVPRAKRSYAEMTWELEDILKAVTDDGMRELLKHLLWHGDVALRWAVAPAAKVLHQAYRFGLMEHSLQVARLTRGTCMEEPELDASLAIAGALLHDLGKILAYAAGDEIDFTLKGRLEGEIALGRDLVSDAVEELDCLHPERAVALNHVILAHHGKREHGSPVEPASEVAAIVHLADKTSAVLGNFARMKKGLRRGEVLGKYDRTIEGFPYFGGQPAEEPVIWGEEAYVSPD